MPGPTSATAAMTVLTDLRFALVLQPRFTRAGPALPVAAAGALLVASAPARPVEDGVGIGRSCPDQPPHQPTHLRHGQRQQLRGEIERHLSPRPPPRGPRRGRRAPAWPG